MGDPGMGWTFVSGVIALVVAVVGARPIGRALRSRKPVWYWAVSGLELVIAVAIFAVSFSSMPGSPVSDALQGVALGFGFGSMAGLRYGYKGLFEVTAGKVGS
jgi:RsiW-degrading membrane proteinase PrsW (M82 family)